MTQKSPAQLLEEQNALIMHHIIQYLESVSGITWFCILSLMPLVVGGLSKTGSEQRQSAVNPWGKLR